MGRNIALSVDMNIQKLCFLIPLAAVLLAHVILSQELFDNDDVDSGLTDQMDSESPTGVWDKTEQEVVAPPSLNVAKRIRLSQMNPCYRRCIRHCRRTSRPRARRHCGRACYRNLRHRCQPAEGDY